MIVNGLEYVLTMKGLWYDVIQTLGMCMLPS